MAYPMATATAPETAAKGMMPGAETRDSPGNRILLSSGIRKNATANMQMTAASGK